jgi:uncharacterized membrane protein
MRVKTLKVPAAIGFGFALVFGGALACERGGEGGPAPVEVHRDAQGNEHIDINRKRIKEHLNEAGRELRASAHQVGDAVRRSADEIRSSDSAIAAHVKARLVAAPDLGGIHISVDANEGRVTLSGNVSSDEKRVEAGKIAERTKGVVSVDNQVRVGG